MKTEISSRRSLRRFQNGSAVIVVLSILAILVMLLAANTATLNWLRREVNVVDKRETQRLALSATNELRSVPSATRSPSSK